MSARTGITIVALLLAVAAPRPLLASAASCGDFTGPSCGDAAGDGLCAAGEDCIDTGGGCECRPRVCCKCEAEAGATGGNGAACDLPCTQTGIGVLACVGICLGVDVATGNACNLQVVNQATCSGDTCPTAGCCTFAGAGAQGAAGQTAATDVCFETDAASCSLVQGVFVPGGACAGGLDGTCTAPTPSATPTATPTATQTGTPTNTPQADGASCTSPSECSSTFCVDGVCCNSACSQTFDTCNAPPAPGTCVQVAPAPPVSRRGLFAGLALLTLIGAAALWQQRRALGGSSA